jgi:hypothetical protein
VDMFSLMTRNTARTATPASDTDTGFCGHR